MELQPLRLGAAYHGNRMPHHAREDLLDMATHGMDLVVHMLSHTDWNRHLNVMKDIVSMSIDAGLEPWMDNWGLAGHPGDTSFFLAMHPESHMYYSNGQMEPVRPCLYSPEFRKFTKEWIDAVYFTGARTIFWDEPCAPLMDKEGRNVGGLNPNEKVYHSCACPRCRKLFEEQYGRPMPEFADKDTADFAAAAVVDYFREMTEYSASKGAIIAFTKALAHEVAPFGINVNCISPGSILVEGRTTPMTYLGRYGHPADIAGAAVFLASAEADFIVGQNLVIDGGRTLSLCCDR